MITAVPRVTSGQRLPWEGLPTPIVVVWVALIVGCWAAGTWSTILVVRRRRAMPDAFSVTKTISGQPVSPVTPTWTFVGGGNAPGLVGRVRGTWPFGRLALTGDVVSLTVRPNLFGAIPLRARAADLASAHPVARMAQRGVGFRAVDGREWYFWSADGPQILGDLDRAGFPVSGVVQDVTIRQLLRR